jgi:hypothetical protein
MLSPLIVAALIAAPDRLAPPPHEPLHSHIDQLIAGGHPDYEKLAAPVASDAEFLRRVTLDLNGTIPTAAETRAFLGDSDPDKRRKLIDKLLASPAYARRMAQFFDVMFMERRRDAKVPRAAWEDYLRAAFAQNMRYDTLVREMLASDGADPKTRAAAKFYLDRDFEPNLVTRDVGRVFLGMNLQCAQCHDHPIVPDYKQDDYYGILAFVKRSYLFPSSAVPTASIAEKVEGDTNFTSVFDKAKVEKKTAPRLPGGKPLTEPKPEKGKEYKVAPAANVRPVPTYSRRELLAAAITSPENPAFARTAVNRLWAMMLGRGLVHPLDMDHPGNPPSHPELLDLLAAEFVAHEFDVKWLLREIALSRTYQRSSEVPAGLSDVPPDRYLVANLKPLSPEQLAYAVMQATGQSDVERASLGNNPRPPVSRNPAEAAVDAKVAQRALPQFRVVFGGRPGEPESFEASLDQTLFLKNGAAIRGMIAGQPGNLVGRLTKLANADAIADELFIGVLSRPPTDDERKDVAAALAAVKDRQPALSELVWALLASAEFRFNH